MSKYEEKTIFDIFGFEDIKTVHFYGYGYYNGDEIEPGKPYRFVEYTFFYAPLKDVLGFGFGNYESEYSDQFKQYITDCDEAEMEHIYEHYDNGRMPKEIYELTMDTPNGCYMM